MPNPFDAIQAPIRDLHQQAGWSGTVYSYSPDGSSGGDWYDETTDGWVENSETATIRVERGGRTAAFTQTTEGGVEIEADVVIVVDPTEVSEIVEPGGDRPASEIVDPAGPTDTRYKTVRVDDDGSGLYLVQCERIDE